MRARRHIGNLNRLRKSRKEEGLNRAARVIAENSFKQLFAAYSKEPVYLPLQDVKKVSFRCTHAQFFDAHCDSVRTTCVKGRLCRREWCQLVRFDSVTARYAAVSA